MSTTEQDKTQNVSAGAGSYVALIVMVWFAVRGAPTWLVPFCGISLGIASAWAVGVCIRIIRIAYVITDTFVWGDYSRNKQADLLDAYMAHIYEHYRTVSDMSKRID